MDEQLTMETPAMSEPAKSSDNQTQDISTEPAKISQTDNQEGQQVETPETPVRPEPTRYTLEELNNVKNFTELDESRLPKSLADSMKAYKEAQAELTRIKQTQSTQKQTPQRPSDPKGAFAYDVFQAFEQEDYANVNSLIGSLDLSIERRKLTLAKELDPERQDQMERGILEDIEFKNRLNNSLSMAFQEKQQYGNLNQSLDAEIFKQMPDFEKLAPDIGKFALSELHFDRETIENTMDPKIYVDGLMKKYNIPRGQAINMSKRFVLQLTKGMHDVYMKVSGRGVQGKEIKTPPRVESHSSGQTKPSDSNLEALRNKAIKSRDTDDWAAYYDAQSNINRR